MKGAIDEHQPLRSYTDNQLYESDEEWISDDDSSDSEDDEVSTIINNYAIKLLNLLINLDIDIDVRITQINTILNECADHSILNQVLNYHFSMFNGKNYKQMTPLHLAVKAGFMPIIPIFIKRGSTVKAQDANGNTAAHLAIIDGQLEALKQIMLADKGVLTVKNEDNETPIAVANTVGKLQVARALTRAKHSERDTEIISLMEELVKSVEIRKPQLIAPNPLAPSIQSGPEALSSNSTSSTDSSKFNQSALLALLKAAKEGDLPGVQKALSDGADINGHTDNNYTDKKRTALHLAAFYGWHKVATFLAVIKKVQINPEDYNGLTPRALAHWKKYYQISDMLGELGGMFKTKTNPDEGISKMLQNAAQKGNLDNVKSALEFGAKINGVGADGIVSLINAARNNKTKVVEYLVENGAYIESVDKNKRTPLLCAAYHSNLDMVKYLLNYGAIINVSDKDGNTPLHGATSRNNIHMINFLLNKGANKKQKNGSAKTPFDCWSLNIYPSGGHYYRVTEKNGYKRNARQYELEVYRKLR